MATTSSSVECTRGPLLSPTSALHARCHRRYHTACRSHTSLAHTAPSALSHRREPLPQIAMYADSVFICIRRRHPSCRRSAAASSGFSICTCIQCRCQSASSITPRIPSSYSRRRAAMIRCCIPIFVASRAERTATHGSQSASNTPMAKRVPSCIYSAHCREHVHCPIPHSVDTRRTTRTRPEKQCRSIQQSIQMTPSHAANTVPKLYLALNTDSTTLDFTPPDSRACSAVCAWRSLRPFPNLARNACLCAQRTSPARTTINPK
jgi:hypothetical protein